jgi:hypothetical protein
MYGNSYPQLNFQIWEVHSEEEASSDAKCGQTFKPVITNPSELTVSSVL